MIYIRSVLPIFSSKSFIVSGLTFRSLIHSEFIVRKCSSFILLQVVDQFSQNNLLKRLSFLHCIFLPSLSKIRCPQVCGFISEDPGFLSTFLSPVAPCIDIDAILKNTFRLVTDHNTSWFILRTNLYLVKQDRYNLILE